MAEHCSTCSLNKNNPDTPLTQVQMGRIVPNFQGQTVGKVKLDFHEWLDGSWAYFFSHPCHFASVCTTEVGALAKQFNEFKKRNVKIIGVSCTNSGTLKEWLNDTASFYNLDQVPFDFIADEDMVIAKKFGLIEPSHRDPLTGIPYPCRASFIVDPDKMVRMISFHPWSVGRSTEEILRCIDSMQLTRNFENKVCTPADWQANQPVLVESSEVEDISNVFTSGVIKTCLPSGKGCFVTTQISQSI